MFCFALNLLVWLQVWNRLSGINFKKYFSTDFFFHETQKFLTKMLEFSQESKNEKLKIDKDIRYMTVSDEYSSKNCVPCISHSFSASIGWLKQIHLMDNVF